MYRVVWKYLLLHFETIKIINNCYFAGNLHSWVDHTSGQASVQNLHAGGRDDQLVVRHQSFPQLLPWILCHTAPASDYRRSSYPSVISTLRYKCNVNCYLMTCHRDSWKSHAVSLVYARWHHWICTVWGCNHWSLHKKIVVFQKRTWSRWLVYWLGTLTNEQGPFLMHVAVDSSNLPSLLHFISELNEFCEFQKSKRKNKRKNKGPLALVNGE